MKKILFLIATTILTMQGMTQPLTALEMLDVVKCPTNECVKAILIPKGYEEGNRNTTEDFSVYEYYSNTSEPYDDNPLVVLPNRLAYAQTGNGYITSLTFYTGSMNNVDGIVVDFATRGFAPTADTLRQVAENVQIEYVSPQFPNMKVVLTQHAEEHNEQEYTEYSFKINRTMKEGAKK